MIPYELYEGTLIENLFQGSSDREELGRIKVWATGSARRRYCIPKDRVVYRFIPGFFFLQHGENDIQVFWQKSYAMDKLCRDLLHRRLDKKVLPGTRFVPFCHR